VLRLKTFLPFNPTAGEEEELQEREERDVVLMLILSANCAENVDLSLTDREVHQLVFVV